MAASAPTIRGFDPNDQAQVASLNKSSDIVNSPDAWQFINPADPLFGANGTRLYILKNGRAQGKLVRPLRKLKEIQTHLLQMMQDIDGVKTQGRVALLAERKDRLESLEAAGRTPEQIKQDLAKLDSQLDELNAVKTIAFRVICVAPFKNAQQAQDLGVKPVSVNTYAIMREFDSEKDVEKENNKIYGKPASLSAKSNFYEEELDGWVECRPYKGMQGEDALIYNPVWRLL